MTARATARRLVLQAALVLPVAAGASLLSPACYLSGAGGTDPPTNTFYFPVGLAVSAGGNVLYVANSDFDLQWNGGTLQSYDLYHLRHDTAELIGANFLTQSTTDPNCQSTSKSQLALCGLVASDGRTYPQGIVEKKLNGEIHILAQVEQWQPNCQSSPSISQTNGTRLLFGDACSPPVDSTAYIETSAIIGAFATDLQLSLDGTRLFSPVRGNATLTWAQVQPDSANNIPPESNDEPDAGADADAPPPVWPGYMNGVLVPLLPNVLPPPNPFTFDCGGSRCDSAHETGAVPTAADTRNVTLPGEPFAMAQTEDGTAVVITHQTSQQTSVLLTGLSTCLDNGASVAPACFPIGSNARSTSADGGVSSEAGASGGVVAASLTDPSMQFVLSGVPIGGDGIVGVPHDLDSPVPRCELVGYQAPCVRPAFLETSHSAAELDLIRYYSDDGSSLLRPFLVREAAYTLAVNSGGSDSRGIVIDDTPRRACKAQPGAVASQCAQLPARVFFASRTPPSLVLGEIGGPSASGDGSFDPDQLVITGNVPLQVGPSKVYLAPIVDATGRYALRVFVACFDSNQIFVYDPQAGVIENVINTGPGPFAMAFDPFSLDDVAQNNVVEGDPRQNDPNLKAQTGIDVSSAGNGPASLKRYRFAYLASFTYSYVQVIDLDDSVFEPCPPPGDPTESCNVTFERPVFSLGQPIAPKGS
jgi:hypothetical protein